MSVDEIRRYHKTYPGAVSDDAQAEERQQRIDFKSERANHSRTGANRGVVFSTDALPDLITPRLEEAAAYWKDRP